MLTDVPKKLVLGLALGGLERGNHPFGGDVRPRGLVLHG